MNLFSTNATVVLVHGAWADGSSWNRVILPLLDEGLKVICPPIPLTSLSNDVAALNRVLERTEGPVLLAGHAYAGAVIAGATDEKVRSLVYIAALAPDEGETVADVFYREEAHPQAPRLQPDAHGLIWMPEEGFRNAFAQNASDDVKAIIASVQRPIAVGCIQEPAPKPAWRSKPSWFLIAEEDRMINPKTQHFMAKRMAAKVRVHPVDHTPLLTAPEVVIDIVREAARETLTSWGT
ncbi:MAG TPA: alpha/beta hydrolase [Chthoniobacterales bacterium]|jgi:pimeloyl-ACP methyl ester carboxylesterase|nr:alpha/beta hydrolase [Chthoniobacterales bacterium]